MSYVYDGIICIFFWSLIKPRPLFIYLFIYDTYWLTCIHVIYLYVFVPILSSGFWFQLLSFLFVYWFLSKKMFCILIFYIWGDNIHCDSLCQISCFGCTCIYNKTTNNTISMYIHTLITYFWISEWRLTVNIKIQSPLSPPPSVMISYIIQQGKYYYL